MDNCEPGFGFCSETNILFGSPFTYVFTVNPASSKVFLASVTVFSLTLGTVIASEELLSAVSLDGIPKYGRISLNICETTGPANVPPWWLFAGGS